MPFPVACGCGQKFMAQDHLSGKEVPCPACGNPLLIQPLPTAAASRPPMSAPPKPAAKPAASALQIAVRCGCGKAYKAPAALRGKSLKCPACGQDVPIPLSAPPAVPTPAAASVTPDPFETGANALDGDLFSADPFAGAPLANDPLGGDIFGTPLAGGSLGGPLTMPTTGAPQPAQAQAAYGAPLSTGDDGGGNTKLLVFLGVGVGVVLLGLVIGIWLVNRNKGVISVATPTQTPLASPATTPTATLPAPTVPPTTTPAAPTQAGVVGNPMNPLGVGTEGPGSPQLGPMPGVSPASNGANVGGVPSSSGTRGGPASGNPMGPTVPSGSPSMPAGANSASPGNTGSSKADSGQDPPASRPIGKVLGLGLLQGHSSGKIVGVRKVGEGDNVQAHYSWMHQILPFIGHQEHYGKFTLDKPLSDKVNLQLCSKIIPEFLNPGDDRTRWKGYPFENFALTHFVGMSGVEDARNVVAAKLPRSDPRAGIFSYGGMATPAEITDGTSNTIMVLGGGELASPWVMGGGATIRGAREPYFDKISGFGSKGTSGVTVVMADGSVRVISSNINPAVFRALCTIHGAEKIDLASDAPPSTDK
ncbi:MAG: DUF1559 domain-containing protein [Pirellulaceae bacterium]|nr:DUF1559 domain-containing protein [Pirellulaceae bacterium]